MVAIVFSRLLCAANGMNPTTVVVCASTLVVEKFLRLYDPRIQGAIPAPTTRAMKIYTDGGCDRNGHPDAIGGCERQTTFVA